jgi:hypothetical protein
VEFVVDAVDLAEDRGFGWKQAVGQFEAFAEPVLGVHDVALGFRHVLLDESGFGREAVETYSQISDF